MKPNIESVDFFGIRIHRLCLEAVLEQVVNSVVNQEKLALAHVNIHAMNLVYEYPYIRQVFREFDIVFCDGVGLRLVAGWAGRNLPQRFTPPDFIHDLLRRLTACEGSVYLLGAAPGVAERAAAALVSQTPGLRIAGVQHGYFEKTPASPENRAVLEAINKAKPSLLLVGFGMPLQETWLAENWDRLDVNAALTVGALFDTLAGDIPRAPRWITDYGFEWLARLLVEPGRLWRRYLFGIPLFLWRVLKIYFLGKEGKVIDDHP